jgi:cellulose synthase/poly-beta-1,6-N-acetylglucosamine synthase-like glycosyltransferase
MLLQLLCGAFLAPALLFGLYYAFLCVAGLMMRPREYRTSADPCHTFAIVIPAHNEETTLPDVLHSCAALDYPRSKIKIYVIADNCSDQTARIARQHGAMCLERHDPVRRGKGHARPGPWSASCATGRTRC